MTVQGEAALRKRHRREEITEGLGAAVSVYAGGAPRGLRRFPFGQRAVSIGNYFWTKPAFDRHMFWLDSRMEVG